MAFTRNWLKSCGLTDEQISSVMEEHTAVVDTLKEQRDGYKADAEKLPGVQKELDDLKNGEDYKKLYDKEHNAFEAYKKQIADEEQLSKVKAAYRKLLADEKISEKRLDAVIRLTDFSGIKLDKDGNLQDVDKLKKAIGDEWGDYKVTTVERGVDVPTPPKMDNGGKPVSRAAELAAQYHAQKYGTNVQKE